MMNAQAVRVINPILTTFVQGYRRPNLIGEALFPRVPVQVSGGQVIEFGKEAFKLYNSRRAPGSNTKRIQFGYLGRPFALVNHGLEAPVPREYLRDAKLVPGIDMGERAVRLVMNNELLQLEYDQGVLATDATQYDANHKIALAGVAKWSDPTCVITPTIDTYREAIRSTVGIYPNTMLLSATAFNAAKNNPSILDKFKYTSSDSVTAEMLAKLWNINKVVVGEAVTADDSGAMTDIWGNNAVLAYVPESPSTLEEPSYGYTYTMEAHPLVEEPYYDNNAKSWVYGVGFERAPVLSGITSGFLIQTPA